MEVDELKIAMTNQKAEYSRLSLNLAGVTEVLLEVQEDVRSLRHVVAEFRDEVGEFMAEPCVTS